MDLSEHVHNACVIAHEHWYLPDRIKTEIYSADKYDASKVKYLKHISVGRYGLVYVPEQETLYIIIRSDDDT